MFLFGLCSGSFNCVKSNLIENCDFSKVLSSFIVQYVSEVRQ